MGKHQHGALVSAVVEGIGVSILPERLVRRRLPGTIHAVEIEGISFRGISS